MFPTVNASFLLVPLIAHAFIVATTCEYGILIDERALSQGCISGKETAVLTFGAIRSNGLLQFVGLDGPL